MFREDENYVYYGDVKIALKEGHRTSSILAYDLNNCSVRLQLLHKISPKLYYNLRINYGKFIYAIIFISDLDKPHKSDPNYYDKILELSIMLRRQHDAMEFVDESLIPYKEWEASYTSIASCEYNNLLNMSPLKMDESCITTDHTRSYPYFYVSVDIVKEKVSRYMTTFTATKCCNVKRVIN